MTVCGAIAHAVAGLLRAVPPWGGAFWLGGLEMSVCFSCGSPLFFMIQANYRLKPQGVYRLSVSRELLSNCTFQLYAPGDPVCLRRATCQNSNNQRLNGFPPLAHSAAPNFPGLFGNDFLRPPDAIIAASHACGPPLGNKRKASTRPTHLMTTQLLLLGRRLMWRPA